MWARAKERQNVRSPNVLVTYSLLTFSLLVAMAQFMLGKDSRVK